MPPRLIFYTLVFLALCLGLPYWSQRQRAVSLRVAAWESQQADERMLTALERTVTVSRQELTLRELAAFLQAQSGQPVILDEEALSAAGFSLGSAQHSDSVQLPEGTVTCRSLLACAAEQADLKFDFDQGHLRITTSERTDESGAFLLNVYPTPQPGLTASATEDDWYDVIATTVRPNTWDDVGGSGHMEAVPGGLAVVQSREVHDVIRSIFGRLGEMENPPRSWASVPLSPAHITAGEQRIRQALAETTSIDVMYEPLNDLIANLAAKHDFPAVVYDRWLSGAGVSPRMPVTLRLKNLQVRSVLRAVVDQLELACMIRNEMVVITTLEHAESHLATVAYPVHDLVATPEGIDFDSLIELITTTIEPTMWDEVGGPGSVSGISNGWLVFSQTNEVHQEVEALLKNLRLAIAGGGPQPFPLGRQTPAELRILEKLEQEVQFDYQCVTLADVCDDLSQSLGINIRLNVRGLKGAKFDPETPVACQFPRAKLRVQLRRLCDALELDCMIRDEVLWLTADEDGYENLHTLIYDVRPLIDPDIGLTDADGLQDLVSTHLHYDSWDEVGGPGSLEIFRGLLVVSQTEEIHRQVRDLLLQLETHCLPFGPGGSESPQTVQISLDPLADRIEAALSQRIDVDLPEAPLAQTLEQLASDARVPITCDCPRAGYFDDVPTYAIAGRQLKLASVLDHLLTRLGLGYAIRNQELFVFSKAWSDECLETKLYRVDDLLLRGKRTIDEFCAWTEYSVEPGYWFELGGPGTISSIAPGWLAITADVTHHRHVEVWLECERLRERPPSDREIAALEIARMDVSKSRQAAGNPTDRRLYRGDSGERVLLIGSSRLSTFEAPPKPKRPLPALVPTPSEDDPFGPAPPVPTPADPFATPSVPADKIDP